MPLHEVAERVAKRFAKKCWWADIDDLRQEALEACVSAERSWEEEVGVPLDAYAWRCAWRSVGRWCLRNSSIASASWRDVGELAGLCSVPVAVDETSTAPWADEVLDDKRWRLRVQQHVSRLLSSAGLTHDEQRLALQVLALGFLPREVAKRNSVPIAQVNRVRRRAAKAMLQSLHMYQLWRTME